MGSGCAKVKIPANAKLDITGHYWECVRGFRRVGSGCVRTVGGAKPSPVVKPPPRRYLRARSTGGCDVAKSECESECGSVSGSIYNYDTGEYFDASNTDFGSKCEDACASGYDACQDASRSDRCDEFESDCDSECPSDVYDWNTGEYLMSTDASSKCEDACQAGQSACE